MQNEKQQKPTDGVAFDKKKKGECNNNGHINLDVFMVLQSEANEIIINGRQYMTGNAHKITERQKKLKNFY